MNVNSSKAGRPVAQWTFLTNHAHVLLSIVQTPTVLIRDLADTIGITERAVQRIIADLQEAGYLRTERQGRCNRYLVKVDRPLRHPIERHRSVASLVELLLGKDPSTSVATVSQRKNPKGDSRVAGKTPRTPAAKKGRKPSTESKRGARAKSVTRSSRPAAAGLGR